MMNTLNRENTIQLPQGTRLLFIDDEYVNFLYFNELLDNSGGKIIRAVSISQALHMLKFEKGIKIIFISAVFAESFNFPIISFLKEKFSSTPIVTIIDYHSVEAQKKCLEEGSDCYIYRHIDSDHLIESIKEIMEPTHIINYS